MSGSTVSGAAAAPVGSVVGGDGGAPAPGTGSATVAGAASANDSLAGAGSVPASGATADPTPTVVATPPRWANDRIDNLTARLRDAEERRVEAETRLAAVQAGKPNQIDPELVRQQATILAVEQNFQKDCEVVAATGTVEFPDFQAQMLNFQRLGGTTRPFLEAVLAQDEPSRVIYELAKNPELSNTILQMPAVRAAAAISKFAAKLPAKAATGAAAPGAQTPARTPAGEPIPVVIAGGTARTESRLDDEKLSNAEWMAKRNKEAWDTKPRRRAGT